MLWPFWLMLAIGTLLWAGFVATSSGPDAVNACTYLTEGEVARALGVDRVVSERSLITEPANLCDYSVPGGNYGPDLPELAVELSLGDSLYPFDGELSAGEEQLDLAGTQRAVLDEQSLDLFEGERYVSLFLAPGVREADRRRILLELGMPLIDRWLHD